MQMIQATSLVLMDETQDLGLRWDPNLTLQSISRQRVTQPLAFEPG
jgi:hypothetical protein